MTGLRLLTRAAPLAALAVAGFLLGSCGGGDSALTTGTGLTATRPARTETGPGGRPAKARGPAPPGRARGARGRRAAARAAAARAALGGALLAGPPVLGPCWGGARGGVWGPLDDLSRRSLLALDDVVAQGSLRHPRSTAR